MVTKQIWLNLPVSNIEKAKGFFKSIGFKENPMHQDANHLASFFIGEHNFVMMLFPNETIKGFVGNEISDTSKGTEMLLSFDAQNREEVDEMEKRVKKAGGKIFAPPAETEGWMYGFGFEDLDGHRWNMLYMDMAKMPK